MDYYENMQPARYDTPQEPEFHWNWGAFMFSWVFGFANRAWLCFLCFVPLLNIVWVFVSGAKGEKWAWESGTFEDERSFRATMKSWSRAGLLIFIITVVVVVLYAALGVSMFAFLHQNGYDLGSIVTQ